MTGTSGEIERARRWRGQTTALVASLGLAIAVLAFVSWVAAFERSPGWNGPVVAVVLATAMGTLLVVTRGWRSAPAWIGCMGVAFIGLGSGLGRPREESMTNRGGGGGDLVARLDTWWPLVAVGMVLVITALVRSLWRGQAGRGEPLVRLAPLALLAMGGGTVAITLLLRDLVVGSWVEGRPSRRRRRAGRASLRCAPDATEGDLWLEAAGHEADAVVAFTDLATRLAWVGAPHGLIERCRRAAQDEARHTWACDRLAGHYGTPGRASTATRVPATARDRLPRAARRRRAEIIRLAVESFVDGVLGEGFAAARLEAGARTVADPWAADIVRRIASDERRHAALGADIVRWCQRKAPRPVNVALGWSAARVPVLVDPPESHHGLEPAALRRCGLADRAMGRDAWAETRSEALQWLRQQLA